MDDQETLSITLKAVLVALVKMPEDDFTVPSFPPDFLENPYPTIELWEKSSHYQFFYQSYNNEYGEFLSRYAAHEKNKTFPQGSVNDSINDPDNTETQNVAVSADGTEEIFASHNPTQTIQEIFASDNPRQTIQERYQAAQAQSPEPLDHYHWVDSYLWTH